MVQDNDVTAPTSSQELHPEMLLAAQSYLRSVTPMWVGFAVTTTVNLFLATAPAWHSASGGDWALLVVAIAIAPFAAGYFGFTIGRRTKAMEWAISTRRATGTPALPGLSTYRWAKALVNGSWTEHTLLGSRLEGCGENASEQG